MAGCANDCGKVVAIMVPHVVSMVVLLVAILVVVIMVAILLFYLLLLLYLYYSVAGRNVVNGGHRYIL